MFIHYYGPNNIHPKSKKYIPEITYCKIKLFTINGIENIFEDIPKSSFHIYNVNTNYNIQNYAHITLYINNLKTEIKADIETKYNLNLVGNKFTVTSTLLSFNVLDFNLDNDNSSEIENNLHHLYKKIEIEFIINNDNLSKLERRLTKM